MQKLDLFPQMITKYDAGKFSQRKQNLNNARSDKQFADVMSSVSGSAERTRGDDRSRTKVTENEDRYAGMLDKAEEVSESGETIEDDMEEIVDDAAAAMSVLAQSSVVLILEGNMEMETTPIAPGETDDAISLAPVTGDAPVVEDAVQTAQNTQATQTAQATIAQTEIPPAADDITGEEMTEQMARMPEITEKPIEEKAEKSDSGDLCPLENENENKTTETKGEKDSTPRVAQSTEDKPVEDDDGKQEHIIPTNQTIDVRPERLSSAEQLKGVAAEQPVAQDNLFEAMIDKLETMQDDGMRKMSIQLKPEYLGKVSLELAMTSSGLQVKISAEDIGVKNAIGAQVQALVETLQSKGINLTDVEVMHAGASGYDFADGHGGNAQSRQSAPSSGYVQGEGDIADFNIPLVDEASVLMDEEISSVEYRA